MRSADEETLLRGLTAQVFILCTIVKRKTDALNMAWWPTMFCFLAWAVNATVAIYVLSKHQ